MDGRTYTLICRECGCATLPDDDSFYGLFKCPECLTQWRRTINRGWDMIIPVKNPKITEDKGSAKQTIRDVDGQAVVNCADCDAPSLYRDCVYGVMISKRKVTHHEVEEKVYYSRVTKKVEHYLEDKARHFYPTLRGWFCSTCAATKECNVHMSKGERVVTPRFKKVDPPANAQPLRESIYGRGPSGKWQKKVFGEHKAGCRRKVGSYS